MNPSSIDLYAAALAADNAFDVAIRAQFGAKATRWTVNAQDWNMATHAAYREKIVKDAVWLAVLREREAQP